jgi:hypothetical protein
VADPNQGDGGNCPKQHREREKSIAASLPARVARCTNEQQGDTSDNTRRDSRYGNDDA